MRSYAFVFLGLAIVVYGIIFLLTQDFTNIDIALALSSISTAIGINIPIWLLFVKYGWKLKIFHPWLVPIPNISGEWSGFIHTTWDGKKLAPIPINLSIKQTLMNIQVRMKTGESKSSSIGGAFDIDEDRGHSRLFYSYMNVPKESVRHRSQIHYGTTRLDINMSDLSKIEGEYWTSRKTTGEISITKKNK
ncbi:Cap15 family cyclic dinucleotide receptor domain-containing protein [Neolewinella persica]|uniref:Cap15 family cyclic dinucleotide receptor domain-containing protein n=1 Tax=Neolewinella persica TaxID=70998 RepID=UPI001B7F9EC0|nr:hypothetical protein [Neolewinella persica]